MENVAKRARRSFHKRGKVLRATLPLEMLAMVCQYLYGSPRHVFLVVKAAKGLRTLMTAVWWERFWVMHKAVISKGYMQHYFLRDFTIISLRPAQMSHVLRLVYGLRCECCGARWRHRVMDHLKLRLCDMCVHDRFVSNRVLYYRYGLNAVDVLMEHAHLITYTPLRQYKRSDSDFRRLTRDPIDTDGFHGGLTKIQQLLFLWKDDIAKLYDLEICIRDQRARLAAVNALKARFRAARVRRVWAKSPRHALSMLLASSKEDGLVYADASWVVGGSTGQAHHFRKYAELPKDAEKMRRLQSMWDLMRASVPRPFLGFGEVCGKTWLEKFGGREPHVGFGWRFPRDVYHVSTMQKIKV